ncbi:hypothetical protein Taro_053659, partial [Colocasia esculenta]|nr:hypothetical protein [Colocasia esculenta]
WDPEQGYATLGYRICNLNLDYHCSLLAKEFDPVYHCGFDLAYHGGLLAKRGIAYHFGLLAKGFDLAYHGGLLATRGIAYHCGSLATKGQMSWSTK